MSHDTRQIQSRKENSNMQVNLLKAKLVEKGLNVEWLAEKIGVTASSMYRKLNNSDRVTIGEAQRIKEALDLSDSEASAIFLP